MSNSGIVYIDMKIDPTQSVPQSNRRTDSGLGIPYESSYITITPNQPSNLEGSTLAVSAPTTTWGSTITVTAQIRNAGAGASPATRALLVLTPTGTTPTWPNDVSIGSLSIPAIPAYQTVNVVQNITLPANVPISAQQQRQHGVHAFDDPGCRLRDQLELPAPASRSGLGYDLVNMTISPSATATAEHGTAAGPGGFVGLAVGQFSFVGRDVPGHDDACRTWAQATRAPFTVRFLLIGENGSINQGIFLGDAQIPGLAAGFNQPLVQTLSAADPRTRRDESEQRRIRQDRRPRRCREHGQRESDQQQPRRIGAGRGPPAGHERNERRADDGRAGKFCRRSRRSRRPRHKPHPKLAAATSRKRAAAAAQETASQTRSRKNPASFTRLTELPTNVNNLIKKYV